MCVSSRLPRRVVAVSFVEWTRNGVSRHPRFIGLYVDKRPTDVRRESSRNALQRNRGPLAHFGFFSADLTPCHAARIRAVFARFFLKFYGVLRILGLLTLLYSRAAPE